MKKHNPYTTLATAYDRILNHVDYESWYMFISSMMIEVVHNPRKVLELGCGTGKFGPKFTKDGFKIIGMDNSMEMLKIAKARSFKNYSIFCGDMRNFALKEPIDFIFCIHDAINYLTDIEDIRKVLKSVHSALADDGAFLFDITTEYNIKNFFENNTQTYTIGKRNISWENTYDEVDRKVHSLLKFENVDGSTDQEHHIQRIYSMDEILKLLREEQFSIEYITGDYSFDPPKDDTVMINFTVKKAIES